MASALLTWTPSSTTGNQKVYYKLSTASTFTLFSTLSATANTETVTGLSDNLIYDFKVENNCGGTATQVLYTTVKLTCPGFDSITPGTNDIAFDFSTPAGPVSITHYVVELLDAGNNFITSMAFLYTPSVTNSGIFTGLTPATTYGLRMKVYAGAFSQVCVISSTATTVTTGLYITNVDYDVDSVCVGAGEVGVGLYNNTTSTDILGNTSAGAWNGSSYVASGNTYLLTPIPAGDDFLVAGYKACPTTATIGDDSWIQMRDNLGAIVDLDLASPEMEVQNSKNLTGYGIINGYHIYVRKPGYFAPFLIDIDNNPSGGTHPTEIVGFIQVAPGAGVEHQAGGVNSSLGGKWDVYYKNASFNPFGAINAGNVFLSATDETPDGFPISFSNTFYSCFVNIAGSSYFLTSDNTRYGGEKYLEVPMQATQNPVNHGVVTMDRSGFRAYPQVNSVTRSGSLVNINYTWNGGSLGGPTVGAGTWDFYLIVIKDGGLVTEAVTHYPLYPSWGPSYANVIPLANSVPSIGTTSTLTRAITVPGSYTTLQLRLISIVNWPGASTIEEVLMHHATLHTI